MCPKQCKSKGDIDLENSYKQCVLKPLRTLSHQAKDKNFKILNEPKIHHKEMVWGAGAVALL